MFFLSPVLIHFVILSNSHALPDIIKIGKPENISRHLPKQMSKSERISKMFVSAGGLFDVTDHVQDSSQSRQEIAFRWKWNIIPSQPVSVLCVTAV